MRRGGWVTAVVVEVLVAKQVMKGMLAANFNFLNRRTKTLRLILPLALLGGLGTRHLFFFWLPVAVLRAANPIFFAASITWSCPLDVRQKHKSPTIYIYIVLHIYCWESLHETYVVAIYYRWEREEEPSRHLHARSFLQPNRAQWCQSCHILLSKQAIPYLLVRWGFICKSMHAWFYVSDLKLEHVSVSLQLIHSVSVTLVSHLTLE